MAIEELGATVDQAMNGYRPTRQQLMCLREQVILAKDPVLTGILQNRPVRAHQEGRRLTTRSATSYWESI